MDDETPEMEQVSLQMRQVMKAWTQDPENEILRSRYRDLQRRYQQLFTAYKRAQQQNGIAG